MTTKNDLLAVRLRTAVKKAISAKRKEAGISSEPSADLIESVYDDVMLVFSKKLGGDGTRFSPGRIESFMQQSISDVCNFLDFD